MVAVVVLGQVARWSGGPLRRLKGDERGVVLVQTLLILPILILAVFGGYTVWKVAFIKHSFHSGSYQATRYLCLNPVDRPASGMWKEAWEEVVEEIVAREVGNNGLADGASELIATVTLHGNRLECGLSFTVETEMKLQIGIPFLDLDEVTLRDRHEGRVEC
jgi:hypothetical protein